jgi:hypothetical protein
LRGGTLTSILSRGQCRRGGRVGPVVVVAAHAAWETAHGGAGIGIADERTASAYGAHRGQRPGRVGGEVERVILGVGTGFTGRAGVRSRRQEAGVGRRMRAFFVLHKKPS